MKLSELNQEMVITRIEMASRRVSFGPEVDAAVKGREKQF
jgi:hypothetical protein